MDACARIGESTDAIVMDDSLPDERDIQEVYQRWAFSSLFVSPVLGV